MASAAAAITVLRDGTVLAADVPVLAFEVVCVTGRAVGCVLRPAPRNDGADGWAVATSASWIAPVIARVISIGIVAEDGRCPAVGGVAHVALFRRRQMQVRFGGCTAARRMTAIAVAGAARVVNPGTADKGRGGMAEVAIQAGRDVRRHCIRHAGGRVAVVTGSTIIDDAGMVEVCRDKAGRGMTDSAILVGRNVIGRFGRGKACVVARGAVIDDAGVIETGRPESGCLMAVHAIAVGRNVAGVLTLYGDAVMAGRTVVDDALVVEKGLGKGGWNVARRTILGDRNMWRIGLGRRAGGTDAVVARGAVVDDPAMVEHRW